MTEEVRTDSWKVDGQEEPTCAENIEDKFPENGKPNGALWGFIVMVNLL